MFMEIKHVYDCVCGGQTGLGLCLWRSNRFRVMFVEVSCV